jgi:hypothetical protein
MEGRACLWSREQWRRVATFRCISRYFRCGRRDDKRRELMGVVTYLSYGGATFPTSAFGPIMFVAEKIGEELVVAAGECPLFENELLLRVHQALQVVQSLFWRRLGGGLARRVPRACVTQDVVAQVDAFVADRNAIGSGENPVGSLGIRDPSWPKSAGHTSSGRRPKVAGGGRARPSVRWRLRCHAGLNRRHDFP